jgi:hypothetical protein
MKLTHKDRWAQGFAALRNEGEKGIVARRNVMWKANIILGLG